MDLKPFFLSISYCDVEDRDMIKILWEECIPQGYYNFLKRPENFETLNSINVTFKDVKKNVQNYLQLPNTWSETIRFFTSYYSIYQYVYSLLFPKSYANTRMGQKNKVNFFLCFERWRKRKGDMQTGKNPFNFAVAEEVITYPFEQKPITDFQEFQPDLSKRGENLPTSSEKERIPAYSSSSPAPTYVCPPTMASIKQIDKQFNLPKQKKVSVKALKKTKERKKTKEKLILKLAENNKEMKIINKGNAKIN